MARVLIVEDDQHQRKTLELALKQNHQIDQIEVAGNGHEALLKLELLQFDLVITDRDMPIVNGVELVRAMRGNEHFQHIPVIMVSGNGNSIKDEALAAGVNEFLAKPYRLPELRQVVDKLLEN